MHPLSFKRGCVTESATGSRQFTRNRHLEASTGSGRGRTNCARSRLHCVQARIIDLIPKHDCAVVDGEVRCRNGYSDEGKTDRDCR
jgi:hypothetical protein